MIVVSALIIVILVNNFFAVEALEPVAFESMIWANIIAGFALYLGGISLFLHHARRISRRHPEWIYSALILASMILIMAVGFIMGPESDLYALIYDEIQVSFQIGVSSFLGFLIIIAAFRSFRVHNIEASLLLISCASIILMNAPIGAVIWGGFPIWGDWLQMYPNAVVKRALRLIIGLGTLGWTLQLLVGRETRWVGEVMGGEG